MINYQKSNKRYSQYLRRNQTDAEALLWLRLRRKQLSGVQFYRQKPLLNYIVDFFAPTVKIIIEVDGCQHMEEHHLQYDQLRDTKLKELGYKVLRFNNLEVLQELDAVVGVIADEINVYINPP